MSSLSRFHPESGRCRVSLYDADRENTLLLPANRMRASVKVHQGTVTNGTLDISGSRIRIVGFSELGLLYTAYGLRRYDIANAESLEHVNYDIEANVGDGKARTREEFQPVLQALLADRFGLKLHKEMRQTPVYGMSVDKRGFKGKTSGEDVKDVRPHITGAGGRSVKLTWAGATMGALAEFLFGQDRMDRRIVDETGLTGKYDLAMTYVPFSRMEGPGPHDGDEIDVFTALSSQLGLRLEKKTEQIEMTVIDRWQKPSENGCAT